MTGTMIPRQPLRDVLLADRRALVVEDGRVLVLAEDVCWGYGGSGPYRLARAILSYFFSPEFAAEYSHAFKWDVVAATPLFPPSQVLAAATIRDWLAGLHGERQLPRVTHDVRLARYREARALLERFRAAPAGWLFWHGWVDGVGCDRCQLLGPEAACWGRALCHGEYWGCGCAACAARRGSLALAGGAR